MADIETLGVRVEGSGIDETKARLLSLGEAGEQSAARASSAASSAAAQVSQAFAESASRTQQVVETQLNTLTQLAASYGTSSAEARDQAQRLAQAIEDGGRMASASASQIKQLADAKAAMAGADNQATTNQQRVSFALRDATTVTDRQSAALRNLITAEAAAYGVEGQRTAATRRMALAQAEAVAIEEARNATAVGSVSKFAQLTAAYDNSNGGIGRLRQGFVSLASQMTGTNAVVDRTITTLGGLAIGNTLVLGLVVAVAAAAGAYSLLTENERKAREEQDRLTESLGKWYDQQRQGPTGELEQQIGAELKAITRLRASVASAENGNVFSNLREAFKDALRAAIDSPFDPTSESAKFAALWAQYVAGQKAAIVKGGLEIKAAARQAYENTITATQDFYTTQTSQLSGLASGGAATPGQLAQLTQNVTTYRNALSELQREYGTLADAGKRAFNLQQQASAFSNLTSAEDALRNNLLKPLKDIQDEQALAIESTNAYTAANKTALDAIDKQGDALRSTQVETNKLARASDESARLAGLDGVARELVTARIKAENEQAEANLKLSGPALDAATREIQSNYDRAKSAILHTAAIKDQELAEKGLADAIKQANETASRNIAATRKQLADQVQETRLAVEATSSLIHSFASDVHRELSQSFSSGLQTGFASGLAQLLDTAVTTVERYAPQISARLFSHPFTQQDANGNTVTTMLPGLSQHDTQVLGTFAIAASAVQGFTSALNHLTGATERSAAELDHQIQTYLAFARNLGDYRQSVTGNSVSQALAQNASQADALRDQANAALPGKRLEGLRNQQLDEITALAAQKAAQIASDFWASITVGLNSLRGPAGALDNELASLTKTYNDNLASATALHGPTDDITKLYNEQVAAAKAAYAEGQQQLRFSEDAREAYAKGLTADGDAITRRAAEEKELFDDEQAGYTDVQLARVRYIEGLEDEAAAAKRAADAAKALADAYASLATSLAAGPEGTLASQNAASLQPLLDKQAADLTTYASALTQYNADLADGGDKTRIASDYMALLTSSVTLAGDGAAIAAKKWSDAIALVNQATSDIQRDVGLGLTANSPTNPQGLNQEASTLFPQLNGLSVTDPGFISALLGLYTPYAGTPLTNQQETTDTFINNFLKDFDAVFGTKNGKPIGDQIAAAITSTSAANPKASDAVSYAARNLSEVTGDAMADILRSIYTVEREQLDFWKGGGAGQVSRIVADQQRFYNALSATPLPNFANGGNAAPLTFPTTPSAPASAPSQGASAAGAAQSPGSQRPIVNIVVTQQIAPGTSSLDRASLRKNAEQLADMIDEILEDRRQGAQRVTGDPLLAGF